LRRGRAYSRAENGEKGLLFASLCADIERQFEFVQQFWANAPAFHGLNAEPDPIAGNDPLDPDGTPIDDRVFTIPTVAGPVRLDGLKSFVTTMAGGYFFLPSRSALGWLTETALHAPQGTQS
jgi:deferrochelatase/peroxidase EfeB